MNTKIKYLEQGLSTAFINHGNSSNLAYKPQFVSNNYREGRKVISSIEDELLACDEFAISVAFITMGGITPLLQTLRELEQKGIPGKILTTDYLTFSDPKALRVLAKFNNIELKMFVTNNAQEGFHTKGYIFKKEELYRIIIGSSNMTLSALTTNREWNTKIVSTDQGEYTLNVVSEFDELWNSEYSLPYDKFIDDYTEEFTRNKVIQRQKEIARQDDISSLEMYRLQPNSMQVGFINNLRKIYEAGEKRALLISATGTGKTYASAFALRELGFKRVLFLVHRNQIAKQAMKSYRKVFGDTVSMGMVTGKYQEYNEDYIFATVQTLSKDDTLEKYDKDAFEAIVIDESHHSSANSYQKVMSYFEPQLWLGMTATPDKRDDNLEGRNIYKIFNHQIAYEIRLQKAMEEDLLCPFHYFGITDLEIITDAGKTMEEKVENFKYLTSDERVYNVMKQAEFFGYSGDRVKGLIFCSRIDEAKELSKKFNEKGWRTLVLSGSDSEEVRAAAIERLAGDEFEDALDYIISVDIFSEGVDVPEINQVIMLRPTESPIVFIQQLGRGLRKAENKEYVVVIDFIGNYRNNFMIPIALSGDRSYNRDTIRRYVMGGTRVIPGSSTIHFDEISKKRIFQAIDRMDTKSKLLKEKYYQLKDKLGKIPTILDFYEYGEIDPMLFIDYSKTYDKFLRRFDKEYKTVFTLEEEAVLEFISSILLNGKRPHELLMIRMLIEQGKIDETLFCEELLAMKENYRKSDYDAALSVIKKEFINTQTEREKYQDIEFIDRDKANKGMALRAITFYQKLQKAAFLEELKNLITYGLIKYQDNYKDHDEDNLVLYKKYSRKDACRLLNWEKDESSTVYGYRIKYNTCPIFVTYEKKDDIASSTKYEDQFINEQLFSWMTRSRVSMESQEAQEIINSEHTGMKIYLFVKKSDGEGTDFYYMGKVRPIEWTQTTIKDDKGKILPIMNFQMQLEHSVRNDIYEYFTK